MARPTVLELLGEATSPAARAARTSDLSQPSEGSGVRAPSAIAGGAYEGADAFSRELATWRPSRRSADGDLLPIKEMADSRSRDSIRNDAFIQGGVSVHKDSIVGDQYRLNSKPQFSVLGLDETWASEFQVEVETKFTLTAEGADCWLDAAGTKTLTDMVRMVVGQVLSGGEALAVGEYLRASSRPCRTAIQMIDPDRLSNPMYEAPNPRLKGGIRTDRYGRPITYYIREHHPTEYDYANNMRWRAVDAKKPWGRTQVIHVYEQLRPGQSRGVSDLVAALKELRITRRFRDIVLQNAVLNATFAATIESAVPETALQSLGSRNGPEGGLGIDAYATELMASIAEYHGDGRGTTLNGVKIPHLFPGTKLNMLPAGKGGPLGQEFEQSLLRYIAAALGISYEELSRDFTQTNYSSARAAMAQTWRFMQARKHLVADRFASQVFSLWLEEAISNGLLETTKGFAPDFFYQPLHKEALTNCTWIGASRGQIDELKETQAAVLRLKYNLSTLEAEQARLGLDWRETIRQKAREKLEFEAHDLLDPTLVQDNSINAASGSPQERTVSEEPEDGSEENADV